MIASRSTSPFARALRYVSVVVGTAAFMQTASPAVAAATTLRVTTNRDELVAHDGKCSLREAIAAVDAPGKRTDCGTAGRGSNTIVLGRGRFVLSIAPVGSDDNASGDLNVTATTTPATLTIIGAGPRATVIDARGMADRVLSVSGGVRLTLERLGITGGDPSAAAAGSAGLVGAGCAAGSAGGDGAAAGVAGSGGGIFNSGVLTLNAVAVTGNAAAAGGAGGDGASGCAGGNGAPGGFGGGIFNQGRLSVIASTIAANRAGAGGMGGQGAAGVGQSGADGAGGLGGSGGGIFSTDARLTVINSTLAGNAAGAGGAGGGLTGQGASGGNGGAIAVEADAASVVNATVAGNAVGSGGAAGSIGGPSGASGLGGGLFVQPTTPADAVRLQNTIVASNVGANCAGTEDWAIVNLGHDLGYGDATCPGRRGNPELGSLKDNGGPTETMAVGRGSAAIDGVPSRGGGCPATDQRGVRRPQGRGCDIGAYEFALPQITMLAPSQNGSYERGSRVPARFVCDEGGVTSAIATCVGSVARGRPIGTGRLGKVPFVVTATDKNGNRVSRTVRYDVWIYVNPLREVQGLTPRRIDLGVDYAGWGPLLALGRGRVTMASDTDSGPSSCWAISCWPGGGIVVIRLLDGPFAGKYMYVAEHLTVNVRAGQIVRPGQRIATLYSGYPWSEWGWAAGPGPEALGIRDGHQCGSCSDIGDWSTIEGRNMNALLVRVGAPSGLYQATPNQSMPRGWPSWPG